MSKTPLSIDPATTAKPDKDEWFQRNALTHVPALELHATWFPRNQSRRATKATAQTFPEVIDAQTTWETKTASGCGSCGISLGSLYVALLSLLASDGAKGLLRCAVLGLGMSPILVRALRHTRVSQRE